MEENEATSDLWRGVKKSDIAKALIALEQGAIIDARDKFLRTPLMTAVKRGDQPMVSMLLAHGADINAQDNTGDTPLVYALLPDYTAVVNLLLKNGANTVIADKKGNTVLTQLRKKQLNLALTTSISFIVFILGQRRATKDKDLQKTEFIAAAARFYDVFVTYQKYEGMKRLLLETESG